jgi:gamma-glutamyltranspeptidase/glutathione hydrolase
MLAVVYPHQCGAGGDLFALVRNPDGKVVAIDSSGRAPAGADAEALRAVYGTTMPEHGPASVTVPGAVRGWEAVHAQGADLPWSAAFDRPIDAATTGFEISPDLAGSLARHEDLLRADPGAASVFLPRGVPVDGDRLAQPALGATLAAIAAESADVFHGGDVGARLAEGLREAGVPITHRDLAAHAADLVPPLRGRYRDLDVLVTPPPSQGFVLLEALAAVERLGIDPDPGGPAAGTLAQVLRAANVDRDRHLADPDTMRVHVSALLDDGHIAAICDGVRTGQERHGGGSTHPGSDGDTVALVTADADGWAVALIQSLYGAFGSVILEPSTGVLLHDRGACFTLEPGHPNELGPGKKPAHTLMPVVVQRAARTVAVTGTRGGHGQPQIDLMTVVRSFDLGMDPEAVIAAPRWLVGGMDPLGGESWVLCEEDLPPAAQDAIRAAGFRVDRIPPRHRDVGHAMVIRTDDGLRAASDPRSDAGALAS